MGIDYFLINRNKLSCVWLGRINPTPHNYRTDNKEPLTLDKLSEGLSIRLLEYIEDFFADTEVIDILPSVGWCLCWYKAIAEYIKGQDCYIINDTFSMLHELDGLKNDLDFENYLHEFGDIYRLFGELV